MLKQSYTKDFFEQIRDGARQSAREIIPLILDLIKPTSVIDVGCGDGTWLSVFKEFGLKDFWGIDGDYVDKDTLQIPKEKLLVFDLTKPFHVAREFDLVVSLEVAEHLPLDSSESFVNTKGVFCSNAKCKRKPLSAFSCIMP